jgi:hypothetical protein
MIKEGGGCPALGAEAAAVRGKVALWLQSRRTIASKLSLSKDGRPPLNPAPRSAGERDSALQGAIRQCVRVAVALTFSIVDRRCYKGWRRALRRVH